MSPNGTMLEVERLYREYKSLLVSVAYRMLGSMTEAEDAVQDVFLSVSKLDDGTAILHPKAYLIRMVTNRALNLMKAAPRRRETYPGPWLPEPVISLDSDEEPQEHLLRRERLGYALLVLLQSCTPVERAVFVLRESIGYEYAEVAAMLDKSEAACRKIFSRASAKLGRNQKAANETGLDDAIDHFVQTFASAIDTGRFEPFIRLLTKDAVLLSDGGGVVRAALNPIQGLERIAAFINGIAGKGSLAGEIRRVWVSGQQGLLLRREGRPLMVFVFRPSGDGDAVQTVYLISNPHKLKQAEDVFPEGAESCVRL